MFPLCVLRLQRRMVIKISIWSDYKVGALTDEQFENECIRMNNRDRAERDTYGERIFNGECPYTGKHCDEWTCKNCEVEQAESHLFEDEDSEGGLIAAD